MKILTAVACAAALVATSLPAESPSWDRLGFDGGDVRALVADPGDPATLFAGLAVGGVYRSTDGAATWLAVNGGLPADLGEVRALAVDPSDSAVVYAATARAVYRSADAGASWVLAGGAANWDVRALAVAAAPVSTLFVACGSAGLATSVAGGPLVVRDLGVPEVVGVAVDPGDAWKAYAGTCGQGLLRSTDGGVTWEPRGHRPPACLSGLSLGADSTRIFAATDRGVVRSGDGGNTWLFEQACLECVVAHAVAPDPASGSRVLAGRTVWSAAGHPGVPLDGVFASADGGSEFEPLLVFRHTGDRTRAIVFDAAEPSVVYAATDGKGVLKSLDGGRHWRPANRGLAATGARVIVPDAGVPGTVLAGTDGGALLRTRDGGETWETLHDGVESAGVVALVADPATPGTLLAGTAGSGVLRSDDGGATWSPSNAGLDLLWLADLAADPFEEGRLIATVSLLDLIGGAIEFFESTNGGATWHELPGVTSVWTADLAFDPFAPGRMLCGCGFELRESDDGGRSFRTVAGGPPGAVAALVFDRSHAGRVYASDIAGVWRSDDGGSTWRRTDSDPIGPDGTAQQVSALAVTATPQDTVFAGTRTGLVFASRDGGATWDQLVAGLPARGVDDLAVDDAGRLYAACAGDGLFSLDPPPAPLGRPVRRHLTSHPAGAARVGATAVAGR